MTGAAGSSGYLDVWTTTGLTVGLVAAAVCVVAGLRGRSPDRWSLGATAVLEAVLLLVVGSFLVRSLRGESPVGPAWELWAYLVTVLLLPVLAVVWAREEPSRWSTFVLALAGFVTAVMTARAGQVWYGVGLS